MATPRPARPTGLILAVLCLLGVVGVMVPAAAHSAGGPTLTLDAPDQAVVGRPIELRLRLAGARDAAGLEARLLYDTKAARLSEVSYRGTAEERGPRDARPLGPVERPDGYVFGAYTCFGETCAGRGATADPAGGNALLARIRLLADQAGSLQVRLSDIRVVDSVGNYVDAAGTDQTVTIQVTGPRRATGTHKAPPARTTTRGQSRGKRVGDATGDRRVNESDVTQTALQWVVARASDVTCGSRVPAAVDANRDGCLDVGDVQTFAGAGRSSAGGSAKSTGRSGASAVNTPFTVNSTGDGSDATPGDGLCRTAGGTCTLRAAIEESNAQAGADQIRFAIGSGLQTIQLASSLPTISDTTGGLLIDGYTQPGATVNTAALASNAQIQIQVRGTGVTGVNGPSITSGGNTIRGLAFYNIRRAIYIFGHQATGNSIVGCFVGTDAGGTFASATTDSFASGVAIEAGASGNHVGDTALADRNVISGNGRHGIVTYNEGSNNNTIQNNIVGLSPSGLARVQNQVHGLDINAGSSNNIVGGTGPGERNVFSGNGTAGSANGPAGVEISHATTTTGNRVIGNFFGTDLSGNSAPSYAFNGVWGIHLEDGVNTSTISDNVVVNSKGGAIKLQDPGTTGNQVFDNRIGVTADGSPGPNAGYGVFLDNGATGNVIGPGNTITGAPVGVMVDDDPTDRNTITRNSIFGNSGLGIDLAPIGQVNPNDAGDLDAGANEQLNFPEITSAVGGTVSGTACSGCTVEVFLADTPTGNGEGRQFLGSDVADGGGSFSVAVSGAGGQSVTATATDAAGNTSEFSENVQVVASASVPSPPSLTATGRSTENFLQWTPPSSNGGSAVTGYRIYRGTSSGGETLLTQTGNVTNFNDVEVSIGTQYWYRVTALNGVGESAGSIERSAAASGTGLVVQDRFDRTVASGWGTATAGGAWNVSAPARTKVEGSEGVVYGMAGNQDVQAWQSDSRADMEILARVRLNPTDPTGANYQVRVLARAQVDPRNGYGARITHTTAGAARWVLSRTDNGGGTGSLSLANGTLASSGAAGTSWWIRLRVEGTSIRVKFWSDGSTEPTAWTADVTDSYWSSGNASFGVFTNAGLSSALAVGVPNFNASDPAAAPSATVPAAPALTGASGGDGSVALQWSAPANGGSPITGYRVYRGTSAGSETFLTELGNVTSFTDASVTNGTTYFYEVSAVNGIGEGGLSNEQSATPQAGSTTSVIVQDAFSRTVSAGWDTADVGGPWSVSSTARTRVASGEGQVYGWTAGNQDVQTWNPATATDMEVLALVRLSTANPTGASYQPRVVVRAQGDARNGYVARLVHTTAGAVNWSFGVVQNAGGTGSATYASGALKSSGGAGTRWWIRLRAQGTTVQVKIWQDGTSEPSAWRATRTASVFASGRAAAGVYVNPGIASPFPTVGFQSFEAVDLG